jgi:hypothetical protein
MSGGQRSERPANYCKVKGLDEIGGRTMSEEILYTEICAGAVGIIPLSVWLLLKVRDGDISNDTIGALVCAIALLSPVIAAVIINAFSAFR